MHRPAASHQQQELANRPASTARAGQLFHSSDTQCGCCSACTCLSVGRLLPASLPPSLMGVNSAVMLQQPSSCMMALLYESPSAGSHPWCSGWHTHGQEFTQSRLCDMGATGSCNMQLSACLAAYAQHAMHPMNESLSLRVLRHVAGTVCSQLRTRPSVRGMQLGPHPQQQHTVRLEKANP